MSWQAVAKPVMTETYTEVIDEILTFYGLSSVSLGGRWRLVKCNLAVSPPTCQALDTGVAVPTTDGHYNIRELLLEGDYLYGCYARWSSLNCYRFDKNTGAGTRIGTVAPTGDSSINYHSSIKIKEDTYYYKARVGTGTEYKLWRFKGSPSQITDPALWELVGYIFRDPTSPSGCPEGSINFSYCNDMYFVHERYIIFSCYQRCPSGNVGNFAIYVFDTVKERLLNSNFEEIPLSRSTTDPTVRITVNPPANSVRTGMSPSFTVDMANRKFYIGQSFQRGDGSVAGAGITIVDMATRQATFTNIAGNYEWVDRAGVFVIGLTADGKVVFTVRDTDNTPRVKLLDPATNTVTNILDLTGGDSLAPIGPPCLNTEDTQAPIKTILHTRTHLILPPNWQDGLKVPKRVTVSSPQAGQLRVQAQFQLAPAQIRVRIWKIPDFTVAREETLAGATSIDRTYTGLTAGRYRAEVTTL